MRELPTHKQVDDLYKNLKIVHHSQTMRSTINLGTLNNQLNTRFVISDSKSEAAPFSPSEKKYR